MQSLFDIVKPKPKPIPKPKPPARPTAPPAIPPVDTSAPMGKLRYISRKGGWRTIADIEVTLAAAVVGPEPESGLKDLLYFEVAGGDSDIHGILAGVSESKGKDVWKITLPDEEPFDVKLPMKGLRVIDTRLKVPELRRVIHHAAAIEVSGRVVIVKKVADLWHRIFDFVMTPLLQEWREELIVRLMERGVVVRCRAFALPEEFKAYIIHEDATKFMDEIVCAHVKQHGLPNTSNTERNRP